MMKPSLALIIFIIFANMAYAHTHGEDIGPFTYLRKLSLHIKGVTPSESEYEDLRSAFKKNNTDQFFDKTIQEYLSSEFHVYKMDFRLSELFYLEVNPLPMISVYPESFKLKYNNYYYFNSLNSLFRRVARENLPWQTLLTGKEYEIFGSGTDYYSDRRPEYVFSDFGFFGAIQPEKVPKVARGLVRGIFTSASYSVLEKIERVNLINDKNDLRVAGALSTMRFFQRYPSSSINRNRRRAQAIYRIFLCENISSAANSLNNVSKEESNEFLLSIFNPHKSSQSQKISLDSSLQKQHGTNKDCLSCHRKIDPLGNVFMTSSLVLSPFPSPGGIVISDKFRNERTIPVKGLGELGTVIAAQEEYFACQVSHFWNWFIGEDIPLTDFKVNELKKEFKKVKGHTNDFIKYLVKSKEFKMSKRYNHQYKLALNTKIIFEKCNSCHFHAVKKKYQDYNEFFSDNVQTEQSGQNGQSYKFDRQVEINKIIKSLDLYNHGKKANMPPKWAKWEITTSERQIISDWIKNGMPRI